MNRYQALSMVALLTVTANSLSAQAVLRPEPSGRGTSEVTLAFPAAGTPEAAAAAAMPAPKPLFIRLDYGQPHLRGRALHTDSLVPYDKPWRMGANANTTLTTDVDLIIGGATLAKGSYVLYAVPGRTSWKLVIQRSVGQTPMEYSAGDDVARIDLRHSTLPTSLESLTMWLIPSLQPGPARGELRIAWGNDQLSTDWSVR